jgi:hypothetical protein
MAFNAMTLIPAMNTTPDAKGEMPRAAFVMVASAAASVKFLEESTLIMTQVFETQFTQYHFVH